MKRLILLIAILGSSYLTGCGSSQLPPDDLSQLPPEVREVEEKLQKNTHTDPAK